MRMLAMFKWKLVIIVSSFEAMFLRALWNLPAGADLKWRSFCFVYDIVDETSTIEWVEIWLDMCNVPSDSTALNAKLE